MSVTKDGSTTQQHIEVASNNAFAAMLPQEKQESLQEIIEEEPPILPNVAAYAWSYFLKLNQTRQVGGFGGFNAITYQEMLAMFTLEQCFPETWEVKLIKEFDKVALEYLNKDLNKDNKKK